MTLSPIDATCRDVAEHVTEYLNRGLTARERAVLEQHVFACPSCINYLGQMKTVVALAGALARSGGAPEPAPPAADRSALRVFRRWREAEKAR